MVASFPTSIQMKSQPTFISHFTPSPCGLEYVAQQTSKPQSQVVKPLLLQQFQLSLSPPMPISHSHQCFQGLTFTSVFFSYPSQISDQSSQPYQHFSLHYEECFLSHHNFRKPSITERKVSGSRPICYSFLTHSL